DVTREAALYTYIAASLFRLFTKPASNSVRSWFSIINGFWRFYGDTFNVRVPVPNEEAVQLFKYWLDLEIRAKVTLSEEPEKYLMRIISGNALLLVSGFWKYLRVITLEVHQALLHSDPTLQGTRLKSMCDKLPMFNIHVECRDSRRI
ncbi:coat protein, partial [Tanacetum coccineum]